MNNDPLNSENIEIARQPQLVFNGVPKHSYGMTELTGLRHCLNVLLPTEILIKRCSKCRTFSRLVQSLPPSRLDAWCDDCFVNTPAIDRTRKCSVNQRKRLMEKQKAEIDQRAKLLKALEQAKVATKLAKQAEKKSGKSNYTPKKFKGSEEPPSLPFDSKFLEEYKTSLDNAESVAQKAIADYDARQKQIIEAHDKTIYEEGCDEYNDN